MKQYQRRYCDFQIDNFYSDNKWVQNLKSNVVIQSWNRLLLSNTINYSTLFASKIDMKCVIYL